MKLRESRWLGGLGILLAVLAVTLGAQVSPTAGTVFEDQVPGTLQTLALLVSAAFLGTARALAAAALYLLLGLAGVPVFHGWQSYLPRQFVLYPSAGYLLGFLPAAGLVGRFAAPGRGLLALLGVMLLGHAVILAIGVPVFLSWFGAERGLGPGLWTLLPGMALKSLCGAAVVSWWRNQRAARLARTTSSSNS